MRADRKPRIDPVSIFLGSSCENFPGRRGLKISYKLLKLLERVKGIEPSSSAWKAVALPLSYTRATRRNIPKNQPTSVAFLLRRHIPRTRGLPSRSLSSKRRLVGEVVLQVYGLSSTYPLSHPKFGGKFFNRSRGPCRTFGQPEQVCGFCIVNKSAGTDVRIGSLAIDITCVQSARKAEER